MERLFVDTSAWFAFFYRADPEHVAVADALLGWKGRLITTDYIFDEIVTLLRYRVNHGSARKAGEALRKEEMAWLVSVEGVDLDEAWRRFVREHDKKFSFTDCASFAVMKRLGLSKAAALDPDFKQAGFEIYPV